MAALIVLFLASLWLLFATLISRLVSRRGSAITATVTFFSVILLPWADEIIGRRQFHLLCKSEAVVWMSPDAKDVSAARRNSRGMSLLGYAIPIYKQETEYVDATTGEPFFRMTSFTTPGGAIMEFGLNMGNSSSCAPKNWIEEHRTLQIDELIRRGKE